MEVCDDRVYIYILSLETAATLTLEVIIRLLNYMSESWQELGRRSAKSWGTPLGEVESSH